MFEKFKSLGRKTNKKVNDEFLNEESQEDKRTSKK